MSDKPDEKPVEPTVTGIVAFDYASPRSQSLSVTKRVLEGELLDPEGSTVCPICRNPRCPAADPSFRLRYTDYMQSLYRLWGLAKRGRGTIPGASRAEKIMGTGLRYGMGARRMQAMLLEDPESPRMPPNYPIVLIGFGDLERQITNGLRIIKGREEALGFYQYDSQGFLLRDAVYKGMQEYEDSQRGWNYSGIPTGKALPARRDTALLLDNSPRALGDLFSVARVPLKQRRKKRK